MDRNRPEIESWRRAMGCFFAGAMVVAPFLALLYDVNAGLIVMALGLIATAYLCFDTSKSAESPMRDRLQTVVIVNVLLAAALVIVVILRSVD
jgi:VIT1/CCC1 family predicted Fe2+/Mn2+ transporter